MTTTTNEEHIQVVERVRDALLGNAQEDPYPWDPIEVFEGHADGEETYKGRLEGVETLLVSANWNNSCRHCFRLDGLSHPDQDHAFEGVWDLELTRALEGAGVTKERLLEAVVALSGHALEQVATWSVDMLLNLDPLWCDECARCDGCGLAVETQPSRWGWVAQFFVFDDGDLLCTRCLQDDPEDYFEKVMNKPVNGTLIDPSDHGWTKIEGEWESGGFEGMNYNPQRQIAAMNDLGYDALTEVSPSQFYASWSFYVRPMEREDPPSCPIEELPERIGKERDWPSPAEKMKAFLQSASKAERKPDLVTYICLDPANPEGAKVRYLTNEEFVSGNWKEEEEE